MALNSTKADGFAHLLRAAWSTFWTSRGRVIGVIIAALAIVLIGVLYAVSSRSICEGPNGNACPAVPVGPGGEAVRDRFYFVHQTLAGDGSIIARVTSLTGVITYPPPNHDQIVSGVVPWAKAGVIVKQGTGQGTAYAATMVTGSHGVRMQFNYTQDLAGSPGNVSANAPRWLRLTRSADTLTGYESANGVRWTEVDTIRLDGLPERVQVGLFVTSPCDLTVKQGGLGGIQCRFTSATAVFDKVELIGETPGVWKRDDIGAEPGLPQHLYGGVEESGDTLTITGNGDIGPLVNEGIKPIESTLAGTSVAALVMIVVAAMFVTTGKRRDLSLPSLSGNVSSSRELAAKAVVVGTITFVVGLTAAIIAVLLGTYILRAVGTHVVRATPITELRSVVGSAALLAVAAVFALALSALSQRLAVAAAVLLFVLPHTIATTIVLPFGVSQWLLRLTPAAGFAIRQTLREYPQVTTFYAPPTGYYPLPPWAGFAVLCVYAALAFGLAVFQLRRKARHLTE